LALSIYGERSVVRVRIEGVFPTYKTLKDGSRRTYWYHRASGKRLRGEPGSSEFVADYAEAHKLIHDQHAGTINSLIRSYTLSVEFGDKLAPSTQAEYRRMLTKAEAEFGNMPVTALDDSRVKRDFLNWREKIARSSGRREADNRLSAISAMLSWAVDRGNLVTNHLKGFKRLYTVDRSENIWLPEHIDRFMQVAPIELQRALILALHSGQRQGDLLRLAWSAYDGTTITLRQGKASRDGLKAPPITIRCTTTLRRMLESLPRTSLLILITKRGQPFKKRYFATLWEKATSDAGLSDLHFHDLRGTAITMLSEAGNTPQQIASVTGHSIRTVHTIIEKYLARTRHLSDVAILNFENSPRTKFANELQTSDSAASNPKAKCNAQQ
jgi:integrase